MLAVAACALLSVAQPQTCDLTGTWSGSFDRTSPPATKGVYHIVQQGSRWSVDTPDAKWIHGDGNVTADGRVSVHFTGETHLAGNRMGGIVTDCNRIRWSNFNLSVWCRGGEGQKGCGVDPGNDVAKVHVVWMNHLDIGFTNTIASVVNLYWDHHFPLAIETARQMNTPGKPPLFVYTCHAWLVDFFFNCPTRLGLRCGGELGTTPNDHGGCVRCPNATALAAVEQAVRDGVITWHAFPHNAEPESADVGLFAAGIDMVHALDDRFGLPRKTVISQRDVPGATRGMLPIMRAKGVLAFAEGANGMVQPPEAPTIFNWTDKASGASAITLLHPRGYGAAPAPPVRINGALWDADDVGLGGPVWDPCPTFEDTVRVDGMDEALVYAFKTDNNGPHTAKEASATIKCLQKIYPGADIIGSTFDAYVSAVREFGTETLPVVTSEMGDVWIYGLQADNLKTKLTRLMMRARASCADCSMQDAAFYNFTRLLIKNVEHTWGLHGLAEVTGWTNANLTHNLADPGPVGQKYRNWTASWVEQRMYLYWALDALKQPGVSAAASALASTIDKSIAAAKPAVPPPTAHYKKLAAGNISLTTKHFKLAVDAEHGGLSSLVSLADGHEWARASEPLFGFAYRSNSDEDFTDFWTELHITPGRTGTCYLKQGLKNETCSSPMGCAESRIWRPALKEAFYCAEGGCAAPTKQWAELRDTAELDGSARLLLHGTMDPRVYTLYGAPTDVWVEMVFPVGSPDVLVDLQWAGKTSTRLPESMFLTFAANTPSGGSPWQVDKLGTAVDAADVMAEGGVRMHAVGPNGVRRAHGSGAVAATPVDSALVSVGLLSAFPTPLDPLTAEQASGALHFPLQDNYWDVNYPFWYPFDKWTQEDADARFRFAFSFA